MYELAVVLSAWIARLFHSVKDGMEAIRLESSMQPSGQSRQRTPYLDSNVSSVSRGQRMRDEADTGVGRIPSYLQ